MLITEYGRTLGTKGFFQDLNYVMYLCLLSRIFPISSVKMVHPYNVKLCSLPVLSSHICNFLLLHDF